ncbi:GNAT family N-acetyltransferase [Arthrobacter bambusae]|uniref:N-acetylglutamate synthase-like GNAT family acetyltransferase n=1 Tax=Arthrobacter bambusae TaxID=1338426 RepID=A0AAW8DFA6_9MICC|nr:GNAT family N-acetyltransferase [Arthrobacter bambusae]MDP9904581.1 N-acetylglutamate synthase-like GNAT family acetyltransferase [Arthrobacter bambusae]MDQ0129397.1 N-acetylglutamate synthase-like GNAT family acetyltransferase [Arthrobacter bambusae]MDQ0180990.1 N-acetylglutamate synthase-like GNAT family acetyltransferase [Arthrobacter bambusae]
MINLTRATDSDITEISEFLRIADLTLSGLGSPMVHLWISRDKMTGRIFATTGYESSADGSHALIRSVAVERELRGTGIGLELAQFAMDRAVEAGAKQAWLFSRRSGPFWQKVGFTSADTNDLAAALASTHQVQLFTETGQLGREVAWTKQL